jgi:hypothetical protein
LGSCSYTILALIWVLGLTPFAIAAINIMAISYGDSQVFTYILRNLDLVPLILGMILPLIPVAIIWFLIAWISQRYAVPKASRPEVSLTAMQIGSAILILALLAIQVTYLVAMALTLVVINLHQRWTRHRTKVRRYATALMLSCSRFDWSDINYVDIYRSYICSAIGSASWIPDEAIGLKNSKAVSGQVLATDKEWTIFLIRGTGVRIVHTSDVLSRDPRYTDTSILDRTPGTLLSQYLLHTSQLRCP